MSADSDWGLTYHRLFLVSGSGSPIDLVRYPRKRGGINDLVVFWANILIAPGPLYLCRSSSRESGWSWRALGAPEIVVGLIRDREGFLVPLGVASVFVGWRALFSNFLARC